MQSDQPVSGTSLLNVLVVDDQPSTLFLVRTMLERAGCKVRECASGHSAIEALRTGDYDLLVLDLCLSDMHGFDVVRRVRKSGHPPIIAITASLTADVLQQAEQEGIRRIVPKPILYRDLITAARNVSSLENR